jgi:hypothetical protein
MTDPKGRIDQKKISYSVVIQVNVEGRILTDYVMNGRVDDSGRCWLRQSQR